MRIRSHTTLALALLCAFLAGALAARWLPASARAEEPAATDAPATRRFLCRSFPGDLEKDRQVNTADQTTEIGQWVGAREHEGWQVDHVDFEIAQKPTGYPQAWTQICMVPS
jgi:hypothetical protein